MYVLPELEIGSGKARRVIQIPSLNELGSRDVAYKQRQVKHGKVGTFTSKMV